MIGYVTTKGDSVEILTPSGEKLSFAKNIDIQAHPIDTKDDKGLQRIFLDSKTEVRYHTSASFLATLANKTFDIGFGGTITKYLDDGGTISKSRDDLITNEV